MFLQNNIIKSYMIYKVIENIKFWFKFVYSTYILFFTLLIIMLTKDVKVHLPLRKLKKILNILKFCIVAVPSNFTFFHLSNLKRTKPPQTKPWWRCFEIMKNINITWAQFQDRVHLGKEIGIIYVKRKRFWIFNS